LPGSQKKQTIAYSFSGYHFDNEKNMAQERKVLNIKVFALVLVLY